jgi:hypothetical protein
VHERGEHGTREGVVHVEALLLHLGGERDLPARDGAEAAFLVERDHAVLDLVGLGQVARMQPARQAADGPLRALVVIDGAGGAHEAVVHSGPPRFRRPRRCS